MFAEACSIVGWAALFVALYWAAVIVVALVDDDDRCPLDK